MVVATICPIDESLDDWQDGKHRDKIDCVYASNCNRWNPLSGPGDKYDQRDMKRREDGHRDPKPRKSRSRSLQDDDETKYEKAIPRRQVEIKSAEIIKKPGTKSRRDNATDYRPAG